MLSEKNSIDTEKEETIIDIQSKFKVLQKLSDYVDSINTNVIYFIEKLI